MSGRIYRPNFLQLNEFTFSFNMTNHLNPLISQDESLTTICRKISSYHQLRFPNWTRLREDFRIIRITPENELFVLLDANSQRNVLNWLIFSRDDDRIIVTHFGPFGKLKDKDFDVKVDQTRLSLQKLKDKWLQVQSSSLPQRQKETEQKRIQNKILGEFWRSIKAMDENVEAKKKKLIEVAGTVLSSKEKRDRIINAIEKIEIKQGKIIVRKELTPLMLEITANITKMVAKMTTKLIATQSIKAASKGAAKTALKVIPFVGLGGGIGFALWRLSKKDLAGAGMEVASGAASCAPGPGTVASLAIDAALLARDIKNAKEKLNKMKSLKADTESLTTLLEECEKATEEYEFLCEVLKDPGYDFKKLENDIKVVDEVLRDLRKN